MTTELPTCLEEASHGLCILEVVDQLHSTFQYTKGLSWGGEGDFDQELRIVEVLHTLVSLSSRLTEENHLLAGASCLPLAFYCTGTNVIHQVPGTRKQLATMQRCEMFMINVII